MGESNRFFELEARTQDRVLAELFRENERLRRQLAESQCERDWYKHLYNLEAAKNDPQLTAEDIASAVPAIPIFEAAIKRLEMS